MWRQIPLTYKVPCDTAMSENSGNFGGISLFFLTAENVHLPTSFSVVLFWCKYCTNNELLDTCTYLDPRLKSLPYLSDTEKQISHNKVYDICVKSARALSEPQTSPVTSPTLPTTRKKSSGLGVLLKGMYGESCNKQCQPSVSNEIAEEIKRYSKALSLDMEADPLQW